MYVPVVKHLPFPAEVYLRHRIVVLPYILCAHEPTKPVSGRYSLFQSLQRMLKVKSMGRRTEKANCCNEETVFLPEVCALLFFISSVITVLSEILYVQTATHRKIQT